MRYSVREDILRITIDKTRTMDIYRSVQRRGVIDVIDCWCNVLLSVAVLSYLFRQRDGSSW